MEDTITRDVFREMEAVLLRRVEAVERQNARLQRVATLAFAGFGAALAVCLFLFVWGLGDGLSGRVADRLQAREFVLRDEAGQIRGILEATGTGESRLVLRDQDGRERMRLTVLPDGSPGLSFADGQGRSRVVLGALPDETATLVFADRAGQTRAVLGLSANESPTLVLADASGATRAGLSVDAAGVADLSLFENREDSSQRPAAVPDDVLSDSVGVLGAPAGPVIR